MTTIDAIFVGFAYIGSGLCCLGALWLVVMAVDEVRR